MELAYYLQSFYYALIWNIHLAHRVTDIFIYIAEMEMK